MEKEYQQLLKPENIKSVSGLALIAKVVVEGFLAGKHASKSLVSGPEFSQYRSYEVGDDMRLLDWKMLARSNRYYIKQAETETQVSVKFILDTTASMEYAENGISKLGYAKVLVACLALLVKKQGDASGLFAVNDNGVRALYPALHQQHYNRLLMELIGLEPSGKWAKIEDSITKVHSGKERELLVLLTDLYEDHGELSSWVRQLKTTRNEVVVLNLCGKKEREFPYKGTWVFEDLESGKDIKVNAKTVRTSYLRTYEAYMLKLKNTFLEHGIGYDTFHFERPIGEVLQLFLRKRQLLK